MELTIVGCSGSVPGPESPASSYLVQAPYLGRTYSLLVDLGPGSFGALYNYCDPGEIDAIALSHLHPDHCVDVCAFYVAARYSPGPGWPRCSIYGPRGTAGRLARAYEVPAPDGTQSESGTGIEAWFDFHDWQPHQQLGPFEVRTTRVAHPVEAYAVRITERDGTSGSLVFSGDTGPSAALTELAKAADLLLVEAAFMAAPDNPTGLHLTGQEAAETGAAAGVSAIILTHIPPWHDRLAVLAEATPHFDGPTMLAEPGAQWTIG